MATPQAPSFDGTQECMKVDPDIFFPEMPDLPEGISDTDKKAFKLLHTKKMRLKIEHAKSICSACVFQSNCLEYALKHAVLGVWGGTTEGERKKMRKELDMPSPKPLSLITNSWAK